MINFKQKYAPTNIQEVAFPTNYARDAVYDVVFNRNFEHLMFEGNFGTGKSTLLELIPKEIFASEANIDCLSFVITPGQSAGKVHKIINGYVATVCITNVNAKFVAIDEFDLLGNSTQAYLKSVFDLADTNNTYFLLATNNYGSINGAIRSRCKKISMSSFKAGDWLPRTKYILAAEGVTGIPDDDLLDLINSCNFDFRIVLRKLQEFVNKFHASNSNQLVVNSNYSNISLPSATPETSTTAEPATVAAAGPIVDQTPEQTAQNKAKLEAKVKANIEL